MSPGHSGRWASDRRVSASLLAQQSARGRAATLLRRRPPSPSRRTLFWPCTAEPAANCRRWPSGLPARPCDRGAAARLLTAPLLPKRSRATQRPLASTALSAQSAVVANDGHFGPSGRERHRRPFKNSLELKSGGLSSLGGQNEGFLCRQSWRTELKKRGKRL